MTDFTKLDKILQLYSFKNELGEPIIWTLGQKEIMASIINLGIEGKRFVQIETPTRYGKSSSVGAALTMRCTMKEQWAIIAGTSEKAQIIMDYLIDYSLDNPIPRSLLQVNIPLDKLRQERSRRHLTFTSGFEVRVFSADSRNKQETGNAVMGFGAPYVILDEAALVDDIIESKVFRMIAGFSTTKHLYMKIGNPFFRNHFLKSHNDPDFKLVWIDYRQAIKEGRLSPEYIEKARSKPQFDVLYEVKFPSADAIDSRGWSPLLSEEDIQRAFVEKGPHGQGFGFLKVGIDPSGEGANFNTIVLRYRNYARKFLKERVLNQFQMTEIMVDFHKNQQLTESLVPLGYFVDRIGIGEGYYQTLLRDLENVHGINVGVNAFDVDSFVNLRAEAFWRLREDIKSGKLQLEKDDDWLQLAQIKYKTKLEGRKGKIEIMSKEDMLREGIQSPDVADALMLTYVLQDPIDTITEPQIRIREGEFERYALFNEIG